MSAEITKKTVVYQIPGMEQVEVRRRVPYLAETGELTQAEELTMDLYYPHPAAEALKPAVIIVLGYPDVGVKTPLGCQFREMEMASSWGRLFAASGIVGVIYETRNPASDGTSVLSYVRENGAALGIDSTRIGLWAASGNVPVALAVLMGGNVRCGVLCYGFMLDLDGATTAAEAAATFHFANPAAGRRVEDLPGDTPILIARAGRDQFKGLNESIDKFIAEALRCNLPVTVVNHAAGPHAFDLLDDSEASRDVIRSILAFLRSNLD